MANTAANTGAGAIIQKNGAINFQNSGINLEKPYVSPDEIEYENGGEFREFTEGLEEEGENVENGEGENVGVDKNGETFEVVDGDVELKKMVNGIRGRKKRGL